MDSAGGSAERAVAVHSGSGSRLTRRHLLASVGGSALAAACGPAGSGPGAGGAPKQALSGTVHIWCNPSFPLHEDVGGQIAASFMAKYPAVRVQSESISEDRTRKLIVAVAGGDAAELVSVEPYHIQGLALRGVVISLEDYLKKSPVIKKENLWPSLMRDVTYKDKAHGLVYGPDLRVMYISVDRYRATGLDPDKPPRTWDELEQAIAKVHRGGRGTEIEHLGFDPFLGSGGVGRWLVPFWQLGGELLSQDDQKVTLNNEKGIQALTWLKKIVDAQGGYERMLAFETGTTANQLFVDNKVTHYYATYAERAQEFKIKAPNLQYAFAGYPLPPNGRKANYGGGHTFPIAAGAKNPDGAWAFLEHFLSEENNLAFADRYDRIPVHISLTRSERYHRNDPFRKLAAEEMPGRRFQIPAPGGIEAQPLINGMIGDVMLDKKSIREALQETEAKVQAVLDQWKQ
ncbi:MAG TPA: extracellular solute-binding protein [Chloroflexota bacterium]|nr:extracellular solute-binding protein [Chloroflexota bacterium]